MSEDMLPKNIAPLQPLHTFQTDIAEVAGKESIIKERVILAAPPAAPSSHGIRNSLIALLSIGVIVGAGYGIYTTAKQRSSTPPVVNVVKDEAKRGLITYDFKKEINFSAAELSNREVMAGRLLRDVFSQENGITMFDINVAFSKLLLLLSPSLPSEYGRSMLEDGFFGRNEQGNFLVIEVDSFERAYAGQLEWEKTIGDDLLPLFNNASSSSAIKFEDRIIANRDMRVALDLKGNTLFAYGFYRTNHVIYARNEEVFKSAYEMLLRQNI